MNRRIFLTAAGMTAIGGWPMRALSEEGYPSGPIRLVQPNAAGGPTDTTSRIIAARLSRVLGQSVVVEARPGAGGTLAAETITRAPPDGYTLLYTSAGLACAAALYENLRFDPRKDLTGRAGRSNGQRHRQECTHHSRREHPHELMARAPVPPGSCAGGPSPGQV